MNKRVWKEVFRWSRTEAAVPISERLVMGVLFSLAWVMIAIFLGYSSLAEWLFILVVIFTFPAFPILLGIAEDYNAAKKRLDKRDK